MSLPNPNDSELFKQMPELAPGALLSEYLEVTRPSLQKLTPYLLRLQFPTQGMRYSKRYLGALIESEPERVQAHRWTNAGFNFSRTPAARNAVAAARGHYTRQLNEHTDPEGRIRLDDLATILSIGRSTINGWQSRMGFEISHDYVPSTGYKQIGFPIATMAADTVRELCHWEVPVIEP